MIKKVSIIAVSALLVLALVLIYLHFNKLKSFNNNIYSVIPTNAVMIIHSNDFSKTYEKLCSDAEYHENMQVFDWYSELNKSCAEIDSFIDDTELESIWKSSVCISLHKEGQSSLQPLFIYALKNKVEQDDIINYITSNYTQKWNITKRKYNQNDIYILNINEGEKIQLTFVGGFIMASYSGIVIENAIRQASLKFNLLSDETFCELNKTAVNNVDANIYINLEKAPGILKNAVFSSKYDKSVSAVKNFGKWAELDLLIKDDKVLLNGFVSAGKNTDKFNTLFKDIAPQESEVSKVIPSNSNLVLSYSFDETTQLRTNLHNYLDALNTKAEYMHNFGNMDIEQDVFNIMHQEFALVDANTNMLDRSEGKYLIVKTNGITNAKRALKKLFGEELIVASKYKLDAETSFEIYKNTKIKEVSSVFENFMPFVPAKYFACFDNYLFFADNVASLNKILYANVLKKTMYFDDANENFLEDFSSKDNMFFFTRLAGVNEYFEDEQKVDILNPSRTQDEALGKFYGLGMQFNSTNNMMYTNISINYMPNQTVEPKTVWQSKLDTIIHNKPGFVINHNTKNKEILVQDYGNKLYLISDKGRILWEKQLDAPIISEIHQIDYYHNGKLQYLFNTSNRLYLIDRNGNNVAKYPVNFANKATNGLALFDYDKNKKYRIFVACSDKKTYLYDIKGNLISGWEAKPTEGTINQVIQHIRQANKDYIVYSDQYRNYIMNRRGQTRVELKSGFIRNKHSEYFTEKNKLITTDVNGNLKTISLENGEVSTVKLLDKKKDHFYTRIGEGEKAINIIVTSEDIFAYDDKGKSIFQKEIDGNLALNADLYKFSSSDTKIGLYDKENKKIYLLNSDGKVYKNFPLKGSSRFTIGFLTKATNNFNLIVAGDNNYLYNYIVQ